VQRRYVKMFHMDVTKVNQDVACIAMAIHVCYKHLLLSVPNVLSVFFKRMLQVCVFGRTYFSHICCNYFIQMLHMF
jgi:hypothetical protein